MKKYIFVLLIICGCGNGKQLASPVALTAVDSSSLAYFGDRIAGYFYRQNYYDSAFTVLNSPDSLTQYACDFLHKEQGIDSAGKTTHNGLIIARNTIHAQLQGLIFERTKK